MLTKWNVFDDLLDVRGLLDTYWKPSTDIYEDKEKISLEVEIPGIDLKNININVDGNILIIKGQKKFTEKNKSKEYYKVERSEGSFVRSFSLPINVNVDKIEASYDKGVLTVNIPKKLESSTKIIEIKNST